MNVRLFHESDSLYRTRGESEGNDYFRSHRIDVDPSPAAIEADVAVDQREDRVIAAERRFCPVKTLFRAGGQ